MNGDKIAMMPSDLISPFRPNPALAESGDTLDRAPSVMSPADSLSMAEAIIRRIVVEHHDRPSLVATIAVKVGAEIIEGLREPGSDLNSVDLARRFKTSRTPIREALMLLERQGLVTIPPRRRPAVFWFELDEITEIYQVRGRLLELVAAQIATNCTESDLEKLRLALSAMVQAQHDVRGFVWSNAAFHDCMTTIGGNRLAKQIINSLLLRTLPLRRLSLSQPGRVSKSLDDHVRLLRAFEEHDVTLATALVRSNHRSALETLEGVIRASTSDKRGN
jgi:DNA-binding GntR family transcriptional regulator